MIDTLYQDGTDTAIRDRLQRPLPPTIPSLGAFAGISKAPGGAVAGFLQATGATADVAGAFGESAAAQGMVSAGNDLQMRTPAADAALSKLLDKGMSTHTQPGDELRAKAKDFMPDPTTTGAATQILAGLANFGVQAVAAGAAGPAGLLNLGVDQGATEMANLRDQGVDASTAAKSGAVAGVVAPLSLLLPMTGANAWIRAAKGAAGGVAATAGQAEAERLILQHGGYDKLASQYDPLDPTALALGAIVPAVFGAAFGHEAPPMVGKNGKPREPIASDVALTPEEQAHSDAYESSATNLRVLQQAIDAEKNPGNKAILQQEMERLTTAHQAIDTGAAADPDLQAAARTKQTAAALDASRLTPDEDLVGHEQHQQALEQAFDQMGRGEPVAVDDVVSAPAFDDGASFFSTAPLDERGFPIDYVNTRGGDERFHGTSHPIDSLSDDYAMSGDSRNIYGQGFYTTDAADVAGGYMRKGRGGQPTLYRVNAKDVRLFDMESTMTPEIEGMLRNSMGDSFPEENHVTGKPITTLREAFDEFRAESRDNGLTRDDVQEVFDSVRYNLEQDGYRGYRHEGGNNTGAIAHDVRIFWSPESDVSLQDARIAEFARAVDDLRSARTPPEPSTQPNHAAFHEARAEAEAAKSQPVSEKTAPHEEPGKQSTAPATGESAHPGPEATHLDAAINEILRTNPDQMVQLDGMESPVRAADLLDRLREEAAQETKEASLLEVAAQCAISL